MRLLAHCTLVPTVQVNNPSELFFLVAAGGSPTPSVASVGFRTDGSATVPRPAATINTAGVLTAGTTGVGSQTHPSAGMFVLGLERMIDRTRASCSASYGGTDASPTVHPRQALQNALGVSAPLLAPIVAIAGAGIGATFTDCNVILGFFVGSTAATTAPAPQNLSGTVGGLINVAVFDMDSNQNTI